MVDIEFDVWPPGAFEQITLIARTSIAASGGDKVIAKTQLVSLITAFVLPGESGNVPRAQRILTDVDPTEQRPYDVFGLATYDPRR